MTNFRVRIPVIVVILLTTVLACVVPGLSPASLPVPTADTVLLATIVAETVSAALAERVTAVPAIPTSTPEPTVAETPTPEIPVAGSLLTKQDDGSTQFEDQLAGYRVVTPPGWLAVRINEQEYFDAWTLAETSNPAIQQSLSSIENQDPKLYRLFAFDTQDGHVQGGFVTNMNFLWDAQDNMSLADNVDLQAVATLLTQSIPGLQVLTTELIATPTGMPIGEITSKWPVTTADGADVVVFQKQVFIKPQTGTLVITLSTTEGLRETILPAFDAMIHAISITN